VAADCNGAGCVAHVKLLVHKRAAVGFAFVGCLGNGLLWDALNEFVEGLK